MRRPDVQSPSGIGCGKAPPVAALLTVLALARQWRDIPAIWRETGEMSR